MTDTPKLSKGQQAKLNAALDLLRRTGALTLSIRYQDDDEPTVWLVVASYNVDDRGRPVRQSSRARHEVDAAFDPLRAALRLCERVVDGGTCAHCGQPTGLDPDKLTPPPSLGGLICWWSYDPELRTFRRGCEGDTVARAAS